MALSDALKSKSDVRCLNFQKNGITSKGSESILNNLNRKVQEVDLSYNTIGIAGCCVIRDHLLNKGDLQELNLEAN